MTPPSLSLCCLCSLAVAAGCTRLGSDDGDPAANPRRPGLAFVKLPAGVQLNGRFEVRARINDLDGLPTDDSRTAVTITTSGAGSLRGTTTRRAIDGQVVFDDLSYDRWEGVTFTLAAPGFPSLTTRDAVPVRPLMRFTRMPPSHVPRDEPVGPFEIELVDGRGYPVTADQTVTLDSDGTDFEPVLGGPDCRFDAGPVVYPQIALRAAGSKTLVWRSPGLLDLVHGLTVHDGELTESLWLPAARVGVPYRTVLPGEATLYRLVKDNLPRGLTLEADGEIHGVPTTPGQARLEIFALSAAGRPVLWRADLPVFPVVEQAPLTLEALDADGPFPTGALDETVTVTSRNIIERLRIFFPTQDGVTAEGPFPVVVFHHGAVLPDPARRTIYDRFDHLLRRWASHGFVVATIDAPDLVWQEDGRLVSASLANLNAMAEDQRATIAHLRSRNAEAGWPLAGRLDVDRVIVAGHSRGGGASLITARAEAAVVGGILLKPLDPMTTIGGEKVWNTTLPGKPFLLIAAGSDGDLPYPMVDFLYERRAGPMIAPTLLGSLHSFTCDQSCPPDPGVEAGVRREEDWAVTNAYAVAFLHYAARGELAYAPLLFGREGLSTSLSSQGVLVRSDWGAAALHIDDFQKGPVGRNMLGLSSADSRMTWSADQPSMLAAIRMLPGPYDTFLPLYNQAEAMDWSGAHLLEWSEDGASYRTALGGVDVRDRAVFVFRARSEQDRLAPERLQVLFHDSAGHTASLGGAGHIGVNGIGGRFSDVIVPVAEMVAAGLDVTRLDSVELMLQGAGAIIIDDLRFE